MDVNEQKGLEAVKTAVNQILNVNSSIKRKAKNNFDKQRELLIQTVSQLEAIINRNNLLFAELKVDLSTYDESYWRVIDLLLIAKYGKDCFELITFYLWERLNPDGSLNTVISPEGTELTLQTPLDLWNLMLRINPNLDK